MSKKIKGLLERDMAARFKDLDGIAVINPRGLEATKTNNIRRRLREQGLRMTVVKNTLAKRAAGDGKLKGFDKLLDGPSAVIYGNHAAVAVVARALLAEKKLDDKLELRGLFFDGEIYVGDKGMETASKLPTREEAIGQLVGLILSPASNLAGALKGPAGVLAGILKAVEEKAKTTEAAAPAAAAEPTPAA
jgi:large subunit ribosomal protein L10